MIPLLTQIRSAGVELYLAGDQLRARGDRREAEQFRPAVNRQREQIMQALRAEGVLERLRGEIPMQELVEWYVDDVEALATMDDAGPVVDDYRAHREYYQEAQKSACIMVR